MENEQAEPLRLPVDPNQWTPKDCAAAIELIKQQNAQIEAMQSGRGELAEQFWREVFVAAVPVMMGQGVAEYADKCKQSYLRRFGVWTAELADAPAE